MAMETAPPDPLEQAMRSRDAQCIAACLQRLDHDQREAVTLVYYEGLSHRELAGRLGVPLGTAKSRVRRGLARVRRELAVSHGGDVRDLIAGEYMLGVLDPQTRAGFERRRERDAAYCLACDAWASRLAPLVELLPPADVPDRIWRGVAVGTGATSRQPAAARARLWQRVVAVLAVPSAIFHRLAQGRSERGPGR